MFLYVNISLKQFAKEFEHVFSISNIFSDFFDNIITIDAKNVYVPYVNINNYLFQNFGEFEYQHHSSILLEKLLKIESSTEKKMYVNVSNLM